MRIFSLFITTLVLSSSSSFVYAESNGAEISCNSVQELLKEVPPLRGLDFKEEVPCKLSSKSDVERYLDSILSKESTASKLEKEEVIFKALGIIPSDYPYKSGLINLYREQIGGYYNPDEKYYVMASWMPISLQAPIAIHELTHALQDQHFNLKELMDENLMSDELLARSALIEGDATIIMTDYSRKGIGVSSIKGDESVSSFMLQTILASSFGSAMQKAPPALQSMLMFPYISGIRFAHALLREGGFELINKAITNPPLGSNEILHPEKYLARIALEDSDSDSVASEPSSRLGCEKSPSFNDVSFTLSHEDILGEFGTSVFFIAYGMTQKGTKIASHWSDDRVCFYEHGDKRLVSWEHAWSDESARDRFLSEVRSLFEERFGLEEMEFGTQYKVRTRDGEVSGVRIGEVSEVGSLIRFFVAPPPERESGDSLRQMAPSS
jgi:hypothetical protein